jgi:hypothetical protein
MAFEGVEPDGQGIAVLTGASSYTPVFLLSDEQIDLYRVWINAAHHMTTYEHATFKSPQVPPTAVELAHRAGYNASKKYRQ